MTLADRIYNLPVFRKNNVNEKDDFSEVLEGIFLLTFL